MGTGASTQIKTMRDNPGHVSPPTGKPVAAKNKGHEVKTTLTSVNAEASNTKTLQTTVKTMKPTVPAATSSVSSPSTSKSENQQASSQPGLELKVLQLEKELGESESEKLDLQDRIQALEERVQELSSSAAATSSGGNVSDDTVQRDGDLQETLRAKDHYIQQMERQQAAALADSNKVRARLKRKIKNLTAQLSEAKQESSIAQLELKEHNAQLQDQLRNSHGDKKKLVATGPSAGDGDTGSKMKVILDLSAEVSDQAEKIQALERQLQEKDKEIDQLKKMEASSQAVQLNSSNDYCAQGESRSRFKTGSGQRFTSQDAMKDQHSRHIKFSGSGARSRSDFTPVESANNSNSVVSSGQRSKEPVSKTGRWSGNVQTSVNELTLQRQSTALSDSDSDWEIEMSTSKIHSAPARVRVKSAAAVAEDKIQEDADVEDKWSLATDDNDLNFNTNVTSVRGSSGRQKRRSALKTKLERERNERAKGLLGPSLAFAAPARDQMTDTSCNNTPTPRSGVASFEFSTSDVMSFAV